MPLAIDFITLVALAVAYVVGTVFGYTIALLRGRRQGINMCLDHLIIHGYIRTTTNEKGELVMQKYRNKNDN